MASGNEVRNNILVGLGGTGGKILKAIRKRLNQEYSERDLRSIPIGFLYVDSDKADRISKETGEDMFDNNEFLYIQGKDIKEVLKNNLKDLNIPVVYGADFGHVPPSWTIINGSIGTVRYKNGKCSIEYELR